MKLVVIPVLLQKAIISNTKNKRNNDHNNNNNHEGNNDRNSNTGNNLDNCLILVILITVFTPMFLLLVFSGTWKGLLARNAGGFRGLRRYIGGT